MSRTMAHTAVKKDTTPEEKIFEEICLESISPAVVEHIYEATVKVTDSTEDDKNTELTKTLVTDPVA